MINLCLVVIATQFSETKKREMEKMLSERRRLRQQHSSSSTLASSSVDLQPGDCYEEMFKYVGHLARKSRRHLRRFARRRQLAAAARRQANTEGTDADADSSAVVVCSREQRSSLESRPLRVSVCEVDNAAENDAHVTANEESRRLSRDHRASCVSLSSTSARRPSSLQIDSSSNNSSLRNSPAFASVVSLVSRPSSTTPTVESRKCSVSQATPALADTATVQYLVLPLQVFGDSQRSSSLTPNPAVNRLANRASLSSISQSTSKRGSVQFVDTVKTCVHRTASVGHARPPQSNHSLLVRKASILSSGANVEDQPTPSLTKSASFNSARYSRDKRFRSGSGTGASRRAVNDEARRDSEDATDGERRRTSKISSSASSTVSPVSPNFLEVPAQADVPSDPSRRAASVCRAASFSEVDARQRRTHRLCAASMSVPSPSTTPVTVLPWSPMRAAADAVGNDQQRRRSFRVNDGRYRAPSVRHRAVRRAVSCRTAPRRTRKSSATVGRASSLNEGARDRRVAAEAAASIGSLGLFGSDFLFCSQTRLSSTADIYWRMQQRARINAALSSDSGMLLFLLPSYLYITTYIIKSCVWDIFVIKTV